jgi:hypothetical protein
MQRHPSGAAELADATPAAQVGTLPGLFRSRVARSPEDIAYEQFDTATGWWAHT